MKKLMMCIVIALVGAAATGSAFAAGDGRPSIGVAEFKNETAAAWWGGGVGWDLSSITANIKSSGSALGGRQSGSSFIKPGKGK